MGTHCSKCNKQGYDDDDNDGDDQHEYRIEVFSAGAVIGISMHGHTLFSM
jgi:hypothetical protein